MGLMAVQRVTLQQTSKQQHINWHYWNNSDQQVSVWTVSQLHIGT